MADGYIKLSRCIKYNWLWNEKEPFDKRSAWIDLLLLANWKDTKRFVNGKFVIYKHGVVYKSMSELAQRWGWHRTTVSRFLSILQRDEMVSIDATTHGTAISIVNWDFYQGLDSTDATTDETANVTTDARPMHTIEERKEREEVYTISSNSSSSSLRSEDSEFSEIVSLPENGRPAKKHSSDIKTIVDAWNELESVGISPVTKIGSDSKRYASLVARLRQYSVEDFLKAIDEIRHSKFLQGNNNRSWMINFDWFVRPSNFPKVLEGNYRDKSGGGKDWSFLEES